MASMRSISETTPAQLRKARELFDSLTDPDAKTPVIEDPELRSLVVHMIDAEGEANEILDQPLRLVMKEPLLESGPLKAGEWLGRYRIVREIGIGGMGTVYQAETADGEPQNVAVKVLRWSSTDFSRRFQREQRIISRLKHPNIARLLDSGMTAEHSPYLVMEYVPGESIRNYCRRKDATVDQRLSLFRQLCAAVAYLHQNLVVHRDLKPSNILVTADGKLKLVDFGISKLLQESDASGSSVITSRGLMTPHYASPEQVRGTPASTLSDVYSLGVVLYELLTGTNPFDAGEQELHETLRRICELDPAKPSAEVLRTTEDKNTARKLSRKLRGELDNIVLKAIQKQPDRRYASVEQLDEDIHRYLNSLPVQAQGDSLAYQARKFIRRYRSGVSIAAVMLLILVAGVIATSIEGNLASRARAIAEQHAAEAEQEKARAEAQRLIAEHERAIAEEQRTKAQEMQADAERRLEELQRLARGMVRVYTSSNQESKPDVAAALIAQNARDSLLMLQKEKTIPQGLAGLADTITADAASYELANDSSWHVPTGWSANETNAHQYRVGLDHHIVHSGRTSLFLHSLAPNPTGNVWVWQQFDAKPYLGKRVRFGGFLRTARLTSPGSLWIRAMGPASFPVSDDSQRITGTGTWKRYELVIDVPRDAQQINFGIALAGSGTLWADDFKFSIVNNQVPLTAPVQPTNLDFKKK